METDKERECPDRCELKGFPAVPPVWVPPPQNCERPVGLIVSRDPTVAFIPTYLSSRAMSASSGREYLFASDAIPRWICDRIAVFNRLFMQSSLSEEELARFRRVLYGKVYWTHLHKCCTDKRREQSLKFKKKNAYLCADRWLRSEIAFAVQERVLFVVALGKDFGQWCERNRDLIDSSGVRLYRLPHPSRANMASWYPKDERVQERLATEIGSLVRQCSEV